MQRSNWVGFLAFALLLCAGREGFAQLEGAAGGYVDSNLYRVPPGSAGQTNTGSTLESRQAETRLDTGRWYSRSSQFPLERRAYPPSPYAEMNNPFIRESFYGSSPRNFGQLYGTGYTPNFFGNFGNGYGIGESRNYFGNYGIGYGFGESRKY